VKGGREEGKKREGEEDTIGGGDGWVLRDDSGRIRRNEGLDRILIGHDPVVIHQLPSAKQ